MSSNRLCTVVGCGKEQDSLGLCTSHYHKAYREKHRDKLNERSRKYRKDNIDRLREYDNKRTKVRGAWKQAYDKERRYTNPRAKLIHVRSSAKKRGIEFTLDIEDAQKYLTQPCTYCNTLHPTMSIDRIDSSKGYVEGNVTACCRVCNIMKWVLTEEEFRQQIEKVYDHYVKKTNSR